MLVVLLVILTFIVGGTISYFIERKSKNAEAVQVRVNNLSLPRIMNMLPAGVFIQPSFTWSKIQDSGNLMLGVHPILVGLIGNSDKIETRRQGEHVRKGETLIKLENDAKELHVKSPVTGTIASINSDLNASSWEKFSSSWIYSIKPENLSSDIASWFIGEKASEWVNEKFQQIKNFFIQSLPQKQMGTTMADGGELPVGVLQGFDKETWQAFEARFCL
ncbi:hypothetical protein A2V82_12720 [candidate division KSB1 bacterium RBG_16_48_16]|nr:MAG: hypothetical protein A2V82_12720 [candidate division KSB1 bacterium RBG_16_48_16]